MNLHCLFVRRLLQLPSVDKARDDVADDDDGGIKLDGMMR